MQPGRSARAFAGALVLGAASFLACATGGTAPGPTPPSAPPDAPRAEAPARDLAGDERAGGHTLARHVGRTDEELRDRLRRERGIAAASTWSERTVAERVVGEAIAREAGRIAAWLAREGPRPNLVLEFRGSPGRPLGRSLSRGDPRARPAHDAVIVLKWDGAGRYHVLTSYPEARR